MTPNSKNGFSLVEVIVTAAILLMLAVMALPHFTASLADAQAATIINDLQSVRTASEFYRYQHEEVWPGNLAGGGSSAAALANQLMQATDGDGNWASVGTPGYPYGPYLPEGIPENVYNALDSVTLFTGSKPAADNASGWHYNATTGEFRANSTTTTPGGVPAEEL